MPAKSQRTDQAESTRRRLLETARQLFAARGYAETSVAQILAGAGLARGGLYHHFARGKQELFAAVLEALELELLAWMDPARNLPGGSWERLRAACSLYVSACSDPEVRRVLLMDGPSVASPAGEGPCLRSLRERLEEALDGDRQAAARLAPLLLGGLNRAALELDPADRRSWLETQRAITLVLEGLRLVQQQGVVPMPARAGEQNLWQAWQRRARAV